MAAATLQPDEIPQKIPSSRDKRRAIWIDSSDVVVTTPSRYSTCNTSGIKPSPIPSILCGPQEPPARISHSAGSTAKTLILGFCSLRYLPAPVTVPPVPCDNTSAPILPRFAARSPDLSYDNAPRYYQHWQIDR